MIETPEVTPVTAAKAPWDDVLMLCKKCLRKQRKACAIDGEPLEDWLKSELRHSPGRNVRLVKTACLDLCPKKGVALALGRELGQEKPIRVVRNGDDPQRLIRWLGSAP